MGWFKKIRKEAKRFGRNVRRAADDLGSGDWWDDLGDDFKDDFRGAWERILAEQDRLAKRIGLDKYADKSWYEALVKHGPLVAPMADLMGLGLGLVHLLWDDIFLTRNFAPYMGPDFIAERSGYLIEMSYEVAIADVLGNPNPETDKGGGKRSFFVGHLPDCVFDELSISQNGPDFENYGTYEGEDAGQVGVYAFQVRDIEGIDGGPVYVPLSGSETLIDVDAPELILRDTLKQPWKHPQRFSETYGGPVYPLVPTFIGVYAIDIPAGAPGIDDWYANITIRFLARTTSP